MVGKFHTDDLDSTDTAQMRYRGELSHWLKEESGYTMDELLATISLYWLTGAIGSSFWPYYARMHGPWPIPVGAKIAVPTGYAEFPCEILKPPTCR